MTRSWSSATRSTTRDSDSSGPASLACGQRSTVLTKLSWLSSFAPALWGGAAALAACAVGTSESVPASLLRSAAVTIAYSPVLLWFGRGTGIGRLLHEWLAARTAA